MNRDVFISIRGVQRVEGQEEVTELLTMGNLCRKQESYYLSYDETEATGYLGSRTTLKFDEDSRVTLLRSQPYRSQLIVESGRRHQCRYGTLFGDMFIGVLGGAISSTLNECGGDLRFQYSLDVNTELSSENEVYISVKEV